jgi:hypothetical protein
MLPETRTGIASPREAVARGAAMPANTVAAKVPARAAKRLTSRSRRY